MNLFPTFRFWLIWTLLHAGVMGGGHLVLAWSKDVPAMFSPYFTAALLGLAQSVLLGRRVRWVWLWPTFALAGGMVTFVLNWYIPILLGFITCLLDWPLLAAGQFRRAYLWPLLGGMAWAGGMLLGWCLVAPLLGTSFAQRPEPLSASVILAFHGLCYGAVTGWALALMRPAPTTSAGCLYYDGACSFCERWVKRLGFIARQGDFEWMPFQSEAARRNLCLTEDEVPPEMKLRLADGRLLGGVDACIALAEAAGWTAPLGWLMRLPGVNALAWRAYRWVAANRYCISGQCAVPPSPERKQP